MLLLSYCRCGAADKAKLVFDVLVALEGLGVGHKKPSQHALNDFRRRAAVLDLSDEIESILTRYTSEDSAQPGAARRGACASSLLWVDMRVLHLCAQCCLPVECVTQ